MAGTRLNGSGTRRTPRHPWTIDQKRCLLVLLPFKLPEHQTAAIFNKIFRQEINARDFPNGLPYKSLNPQHREHGEDDNVSWSKITKPESWEAESARREVYARKIKRDLNTRGSETSSPRPEKQPRSYFLSEASRKRKLNTHEDQAVEDSDGERVDAVAVKTPSKRRAHMVLVPQCEARDRFAHAIVDEVEEVDFAPRTPVNQVKVAPLSPPGNLSNCPALEVSWKVQAEIERGYSAPSEQEAHPPLNGLFYRFWDPSHSQGLNSSQGFVAKRYVRSNAVPIQAYVPPAKHLDPTDLWIHLNEEQEATPFVSVSDSSTWSLSKLLKLIKSGKWKTAKLSIIDSRKLTPASVFHAAGFYRQLKKIRCFTDGAHRGVSSHEFLIWRDIPESAMMKTTDASELVSTIATSNDLAEMLRLDVLSVPSGYQTSIRQRLQQGKVKITTNTAVCIAKVAQLLGLVSTSTFEHHRHLVNDLTSSYKMVVSYHDPEEWRNIAAHYAHTICRESETPVLVKDQAMLKLAFLEGVRLGASYDFKLSRIDVKTVQTVQRKSRLIGLKNPGRIISGETDAVKLHVGLEQKRQWKVFACRPSQLLLEEEADVDAESVFEMDEGGAVR